jgi:hypothetical protein
MTDDQMSGNFKRRLQQPELDEKMRDPANWSEAMRQEWSNDEGTAAAGRHREAFARNMRKVRASLDAFKPDFVVAWGDDQYENFKEDCVPAFSIMAYENCDYQPLKRWPGTEPTNHNFWGEPPDKWFKVPGKPEAAKHIARELIKAEFDIAYGYKPLHYDGIPHAFHRIPVYMDYDRDKGFDYPLVPVAVNCIGSELLSGQPKIGEVRQESDFDPPAPTPNRCMELGAAIARICQDSPWRVALLASSSWSHAFLTRRHDYLWPDHDADRLFLKRMSEGDYAPLHEMSGEEVEFSGQAEMLNWYCLAGAMEALGRKPQLAELMETFVLASDKGAMIFEP